MGPRADAAGPGRDRGDNHPQERVEPNDNSGNGHEQQTAGTIPRSDVISITSPVPTVTDSIKDLTSQMQLISNTIGNTLSSQPYATSSNEQCPKCIETSATLGQLQSQVQVAMKRVEEMNLTLTVLQTNTNLVMKSLEMISAKVENASPSSKNNSTMAGPMLVHEGQQPLEMVQSAAVTAERPNTTSPNATATSAYVGKQQQYKGQNQYVNNNEKNPERNAIQEQPSKSFREMLMDRRNASQKPTTSIEMESNATSNNAAVQKVDNLEELIISCASYLTGSPTEYTAWLREKLNVNTIADLAKAVAECPGMLVAGNGSVGMWQKQKFCDAVLVASKNDSPAVTRQTVVREGQQSVEIVQPAATAVRGNIVPPNVAPASTLGMRQPLQKEGEKQGVINDERNPKLDDITQEQPPKSFREMLYNRRKNGGQNTTETIELMSNATTKESAVEKILDPLDDLIASCASYLTGSHIEYTAWLRKELNVNTIADLAKAVTECPGMLVAGNGSVGMWQKQKFCDAVLAAVAATTEDENDNGATSKVEGANNMMNG